ncbi:ribonuclease H-like domain-containing protein [Tanacetum coccineum]|uniref:Ribonuclease H-like domain-containing protein n=1 Tax=Tanacetum coccineum TaxID=301880 RepID=A0ABQ4WB33_9ASTR
MEALHRNNTWVLADLPVGRKAIGCKWIYKIKYKASGEIDSNLYEDVYMALPLGYYDKNGTKVCKLVKSLYGLKQAPSKKGLFITLLVYVDDIVVTDNDLTEIEKFKGFMSSIFMIKDLGKLKYLLGIEVLENQSGICLSQRKYCLKLLNEYGLLACKPAATPLQHNTILSVVETEKDKYLSNMTEYLKLVGKLIYLSVTRPDITYVVHCLSQHMHAPCQSHFGAGLRVLSKKQATIFRSSTELEYRSIQIAANLVFHEKIKHFEIDLHVVREKVSFRVIKTIKIRSAKNVADVFTKGLSIAQHIEFCKRLRAKPAHFTNNLVCLAVFGRSS